MNHPARAVAVAALLMAAPLFFSCAAKYETRVFETTAYCPCGECNGYSRGTGKFLHLDRWNKRINYGARQGEKYTGRTASGATLRDPDPGLFSTDSLKRPWMIPIRLVLFPWMLGPDYGTIAADRNYYPFGTKMEIPGWGKGKVEDVGGAIKGPDRLDLFFDHHSETREWGRRRVEVKVIFPR